MCILRAFKIVPNFNPTTCRQIWPITINPCNTKSFSPEYQFHINFRKSQEISAKLNDTVKSYNKKTSTRGEWAESPLRPPSLVGIRLNADRFWYSKERRDTKRARTEKWVIISHLTNILPFLFLVLFQNLRIISG